MFSTFSNKFLIKNIASSIILCSVLLCLSVSSVNALDDAQVSKNIANTYKVVAYTYNKTLKVFQQSHIWTAVHYQDWKLITNAHVAYSEFDDLYFDVCWWGNFRVEPRCLWVAKLVSYDEDLDLAILDFVPDTTIQSEVVFAENDPKISEAITVLWFPGNWWTTITLTKWVVNGIDHWSYKTDANVDYWNSWWPVLNEQWELVWIINSAVDGITSLGYFIGIEDVNAFLKNPYSSYTYTNHSQVFEYFKSYSKQKHISMNALTITHPLFTISNFKNLWFSPVNMDYSNVQHFWSIIFSDNRQTTSVVFTSRDKLWKTGYDWLDEVDASMDVSMSQYKKRVVRALEMRWKNIILTVKVGDDYDDSNVVVTFSSLDNDPVQEISIFWNIRRNKKEFVNALQLVMKHIKLDSMNSNNNSDQKYLLLWDITCPMPENGIVVFSQSMCLYMVDTNRLAVWNIELVFDDVLVEEMEWYTQQSFADEMYEINTLWDDYYPSQDKLIDSMIWVNKNGLEYFVNIREMEDWYFSYNVMYLVRIWEEIHWYRASYLTDNLIQDKAMIEAMFIDGIGKSRINVLSVWN